MDLRTVILMLAVGSFLFAMLLAIFKLNRINNRINPQKVPFWFLAKSLQAAGSLLLYFRTNTFDGLTVLAHIVLILGCAYESWAIRVLLGQTVKTGIHILVSAGIILLCLSTFVLPAPFRLGLIFILQCVFYFLPGLFLLQQAGGKFSLQLILAGCYCVTGFIFFAGAVASFGFPGLASSLRGGVVFSALSLVSYCTFLLSSFILLMLAKEKSDQQVLEMQKNLEKREIWFQRIVETANEGILTFDEQYRITFANQKIATILGYTVEEMLGNPYSSFFPEKQLSVYKQQESLRKGGHDTVYECCLLRKDGKEQWFLVSAKAIIADSGKFIGSFAMLTDINARKEMELLLEESNRRLRELSNQDSLTGIANRRCFDATLELEYSRLRRSNSKLSVILLDIDYFKEYNDYYGHVLGDECLRRVGGVLANCINRSVDLAARYGGEEFACILPDTDLYGAVIVAERIRRKILDLKIEHKKSLVSEFVTASIGVATVQYSPEKSLTDIIATADKLLYKAKVAGRNRVEYAELIRRDN